MGRIHDALERAEHERAARDGEPRPFATPLDGELRANRPSGVPNEGLLMADLASGVTDEYRSLRARIQSLRRARPLRSLVVTSASSGEGKTRASARAAAVRSWASFTNFEYGTAWARFGRAAGQSTRYSKSSGGWSADVDARPCRG